MERLGAFIIILFVLCIPVVLFLGVFRLTAFNMYFYESQFNEYGPQAGNAVETTASTLYFLKEKSAGIRYISEYTTEEQEHLIEVKDMVQNIFFVLYSALGLLILTGIFLYFADKKNFLVNKGLALFYGGGFSAIIVSVFLILIFFWFDKVFTLFHQLFFKTTWQFPASSLLIRLFPKIFFVDMVMKIFIGIYAASLFLNISGFYLVKKEKLAGK